MSRVVVQLQWPEGVAVPPGARARVTVEDVTRADASSVVVGETVVEGVDPADLREVDVDVPDADPAASLSVRVHVAPADRRGLDVELGDLVSTSSHPVLTRGHGSSVVVPLTLVGGGR